MPAILYYVVRQSSGLLRQTADAGRSRERLVPMIPVDQLPDWIEIVGVPREIQAENAANMTALLDLGRKGESDGAFQVRLLMDAIAESVNEESEPHTKDAVHCHATDASASASAASEPASSSAPVPSAASAASAPSSLSASADEPCAHENGGEHTDPYATRAAAQPGANKETAAPDEDPSAWVPGLQGEKPNVLPCKYWCNNGRCGFQTRCKFAHVMPLTREGLRTVGLDELPPWYIRRPTGQSVGHSTGQSAGHSTGCAPGRNKNEKAPAKSPRPCSSGSSPTVRSRLHQKKHTTAAAASRTTKKPGSNRKTRAAASASTRKPASLVAASQAVEVDDLIDLS